MAYDFVFDACGNGQQLKCLTIIDEYTRECLAIDVAGSIRSTRVIEVLSRLVSVHGAPRYLRSDNGPEFVSRGVLKLLTDSHIDTAFIDPGKPWLNGMNESFNGKFRDECLNMQWFKNRTDAKVMIETFTREYNEIRPHSSLGQLPKLPRVRRKPAGQLRRGLTEYFNFYNTRRTHQRWTTRPPDDVYYGRTQCRLAA